MRGERQEKGTSVGITQVLQLKNSSWPEMRVKKAINTFCSNSVIHIYNHKSILYKVFDMQSKVH